MDIIKLDSKLKDQKQFGRYKMKTNKMFGALFRLCFFAYLKFSFNSDSYYIFQKRSPEKKYNIN